MSEDLTPFLECALTQAVSISDNGNRCFRAADLARALWPDSPGWYRLSNTGVCGAGIRRAAGAPLARLKDAGYVMYCTDQHARIKGNRSCDGYRLTQEGLNRAAPATTERTCWHCGRRFHANTPTQKFCSHTHRKQWSRTRPDWEPCPHPFKIMYNDLEVALTAAKEYGGQHPYMCACGAWHLATTRGRGRNTRTRRLITFLRTS